MQGAADFTHPAEPRAGMRIFVTKNANAMVKTEALQSNSVRESFFATIVGMPRTARVSGKR
jgi:predicted secreted protein